MKTYDFSYDDDTVFSHKIDSVALMRRDYKRHFHKTYEMLLFIKGKVEYVVENNIYALSRGDLLLIKPGEHHYIASLNKQTYDRYVIKFPESAIPPHLQKKISRVNCFRNVLGNDIYQMFIALDEQAESESGDDLKILQTCKLWEILIRLCRLDSCYNKPETVNDRLNSILAYINSHLNEPLTLQDVSLRFYLSKSYISKLFCDSLQTSPAQYVRTKRVFMSAHLIAEGQKPTQVYEKCGFDTYSTFYRAYVSVMGRPPSTAREPKTNVSDKADTASK